MAEKRQLLQHGGSESDAEMAGADLPGSGPSGDEPSDTDLARAAADGDRSAFDELYRRHSQAAWRVAYAATGNRDDAADAVAEAFTRVLTAVDAGRLSDVKRFRPYVLTTTRNAAVDILRRTGRVRPTDAELGDQTAPAASLPGDRLMDSMDASLVASAFRSLPERWRSVLWLTAVEGIAPADAANLLGVSPNGAAQLAVRARAGLRQRFLQAHLRAADVEPECRRTVELLGAYVGGGLAPRDIAKVDQHLAACTACAARRDELEDVGLALRRVLIPLPLALGGLVWQHWLHTMRDASRTPKPLMPLGAQRALTGVSLGLLGLGIIGASIIGQSPLGSGPTGRPAADVPIGQSPVLIAEAAAAAQAPATPLPLIPGPGLGSALATVASSSAGGGASSANPIQASSGPGGTTGTQPGGSGPTSSLPVPGVTQSGPPASGTAVQLSGQINLAPAPIQITVGAGTQNTGATTNVAGTSNSAGSPPASNSGTSSSSTPSATITETNPASGSSTATVPSSAATTLVPPALGQAVTNSTSVLP